MRVSEHANYLLNEYGRLQFDYAAYCKPDGESLRNEARNNLEEYIAELEEENDRLQAAWFVEETICPDGSLKPKASALLSRIAELEAELGKDVDLTIVGLRKELLNAQSRIAELEAFIDQLIEAGDAMSNAHSMWVAEEDKWDALVKDWEERER